LPFVGVTAYEITVKDAGGKEVGTATASAASGTTSLDLDLRKLVEDEAKAAQRFSELAFGKWTVDIGVVGAVVPPMDTGQVDDAVEKRFVTSLISVFGAQPKPCKAVTQFIPVGVKEYRFQDDKASGPAFPPDPSYTYVGPLPDGTLGTRTPEPVTIGGASELRAFIQGPSEAASGLLSAELIDLDPGSGAAATIGQSQKDVTAKASSTQPVETKVPIAVAVPHTVPVGHQVAIRFRITFVGTSGHTLFYDSDKYPSGVAFQTGQVAHEDCPQVIDTTPGPVTSPSDGPAGDKK
jgi:hypothetical protein